MKIRIIHSNGLATVQDTGRPQWRAAGVPASGAADISSHRIANMLAGNSANAASLEYSGGRFSAVLLQGGRLAHAGAGGRLLLNGVEQPGQRTILAPAGALLEIRPRQGGNFSYLATSGGWNVPEVLGSRSTCLVAEFGGLEGRSLRSGDMLEAVMPAEYDLSGVWTSPWRAGEEPAVKNDETTIRVLPGPESDRWDADARHRFFETPFTVGRRRDRMGVRLEGHSVTAKNAAMLSAAVLPGTIQVPPDGQPIVLMADAQTTGGYPRIAQVIAADLPLFAQIAPGGKVFFQETGIEEAEHLRLEQEKVMRKMQLALRFKMQEYAIR
ncbi:MAG: 5-oxoprolinase/urea amidolyase family protein [Saprospiraceae bacterium]